MELYRIKHEGRFPFIPEIVAINQQHAEYLAVKNNGFGQGVFKNAKVEKEEGATVLIVDSSSCAISGFDNSDLQTSTILCF